MNKERRKLRIVGAKASGTEPWWPTSAEPAEEIREAERRLRVMARMMIDFAAEDVLITDAEIRRARSASRLDLVAAKITAEEWFLGPWHGFDPRFSLEWACSVLPFDPSWIRRRVREVAVPTRYYIPDDWRARHLFDDRREDRVHRKPGEASAPPDRAAAAARLVSSFKSQVVVHVDDREFSNLVLSASRLLKSA